jgi:hypothetical protein
LHAIEVESEVDDQRLGLRLAAAADGGEREIRAELRSHPLPKILDGIRADLDVGAFGEAAAFGCAAV